MRTDWPSEPWAGAGVGTAAWKQGRVKVLQTGDSANSAETATEARVIVFICANCAREGVVPPSRFCRPSTPDFPWRSEVEEVVVPCTGRLQPEHMLKAFEAGATAVCIVGCQEDNCHNTEGSCRAARRVQYVQGLLDQIGLGGARLMLFHLPGSAREDMAVGAGNTVEQQSHSNGESTQQIRDIATRVGERLRSLTPNPMFKPAEAKTEAEVSEPEAGEENDE